MNAELGTAPAAPTLHLEVRNLALRRGGRTVFSDLSCDLPRGKITVIAGASGSGKTTLLRILACLLRPDRGEVRLDGVLELVGLEGNDVQRYRNRVGMLFQRGALLDSMTVFDNVALPLREQRTVSEVEIAERVHAAFAAVGLEAIDELLPGELSGGMVKRVALARALIRRPAILLCDEPFSGLDPPTLRRVERLLTDVNHKTGATLILTSHHIASTLRSADHVVMLLAGGAVSGAPSELLTSPHPEVSEFFREPERSDEIGLAP